MARVLIIDDRPDDLDRLRALLREHGWEVVEPATAPEPAIGAVQPVVVVEADRMRAGSQDVDAREAIEASLQESRQTYQGLFENAPVAMWLEDFAAVRDRLAALGLIGQPAAAIASRFARDEEAFEGCVACVRVIDVNRAGLTLHAASSKAELLQGLARLTSEESRDALVEQFVAIAQGRAAVARETMVRTLDGRLRHVQLRWVVMPGHERDYGRVLVTTEDLDARKVAEARTEHLGRLYAALSEVSQTIVRVTSRDELFPAICRAAMKHGGFLGAWLGRWDAAAGTLTVVAAAGKGEAQLVGVALPMHAPGLQRSLLARALIERRLVVTRDLWVESGLERELAERHGVRSAAAVPFHHAGEIVGVLALGAAEVDFFAPGDLQRLVEEMGANISFAHDAMVTDAERRRAERAEAHALAVADATIRSLPGIFYMFSREGRFVRWNQAFETISGYGRDEIAALHPTDLFGGDERALIDQRIGQAFDDGAADVEAHLIAKDGTRTRFYFTGRRVMLDGQPHLVGVGVDLTARRQAEASLRHLAQAVAAAGDVLFLTDRDGVITQVNERFVALYGHRGEDVIGKVTPRILKSGLHPRAFYGQTWDSLQRGETVHNELCNRSKDGRLLDIEQTITPFRDEQGVLAGFLAVQREIGARKQAERALRRLADAVNASGDAVFTTDPDGTITSVNAAFVALYGYPADEVVGKATPTILESGRHPREFFEQQWARLRAGEPIRNTLVNRTKDGRLVDIESSAGPFLDAQGALAGFIAIHRDVSARKQAQDEARLLQAVTLGVAAARDLDAALGHVLRQVCETTGWAMGEVWVPDRELARLACHPVWHAATPGLAEFRRGSLTCRFAPGEGLPGRVWQTKRPEWATDLTSPSRFPRFAAAADAGLTAGLGVPVLAHGEVVLVLTFFLAEFERDDQRRVEVIAALGVQIGSMIERKQAEAALQASETKHRLLFETSRDALMTLTPPGWCFTAGNPAALALFGVQAESEFVSFRPWDLSPEFQADGQPSAVTAPAMLDAAMRDGTHFFEWSFRRVSGNAFPATVLLTRLELNGQALLQATVRDVTAQRRTEAALRDAERLAVSALEALSAHLVILDADGTILAVNHGWRDFAAANGAATTAVCEGVNYLKACDAVTGPDAEVASAFATGIREVTAGRRREFTQEYPCHAPAQRRWFMGRVTRFTGEGPVRVVVAHEDITARVLAEEQLAAREAHFRGLIENASDLVTELDARGRILLQGPSIERLLGYRPVDVVGTQMADWVHPEDVSRAVAAMQQAFVVPGQSVTVEYRARHQDGSWRTLESVGRLVRRDPGTASIVVNSRDVTDRRRLETQLVTTERMASMGMLAAGVAHEINNPLAAVIGNVDVAIAEVDDLTARGELPSDVGAALRDARDAADRVRTIVRDLKIFSRAEEDRTGPVDVRKVVESAARLAWNEVRHHARIEKAYRDVPLVEANEARLGQVFLNLLVNAAQAMPEGHADANVIRISTEVGPGATVAVTISDTGVGMPPEVQARLFEPFFTTKPAGVGTGLGLAICQRIVASAGGRIEVDSAPGRGSTFRVILPAAAPASVALAASSGPTSPPGLGRRGRVLVVDDEASLGRLIQRVLGDDHDVTASTSALDALGQIAAGARFDVILCDVMMPVTTGIEFHERLDQLVPGEGGKIVFVTGGAFTPEARAFLDRSPNLKVEKPFDAAVLRALVAERLR